MIQAWKTTQSSLPNEIPALMLIIPLQGGQLVAHESLRLRGQTLPTLLGWLARSVNSDDA